MLHRIKAPSCSQHLLWIVNLQRTLLEAILKEDVTGLVVNEEWVVAQLTEIDSIWVKKFIQKRDTGGIKRSLLEHMRALADMPLEAKQRLQNAFENDLLIKSAYQEETTTKYKPIGVDGFDEVSVESIRGFFDIFYSPGFYKQFGYQIPDHQNNYIPFNRDIYLECFFAENEDILVCPFCDDSIGDPEVDHFFPKSKFPELSCHPLNLVPICHTCNSRRRKGEKVPLDLDQPDPARNWLHPYLRPGWGKFTVRLERSGNNLKIMLISSDDLWGARLNNYVALLGIDERWKRAISRTVRSTQQKIRRHQQRLGRIELSEEELCAKLKEWSESAEDEMGLVPHSVAKQHYLQLAANREPTVFNELWIFNSNSDALTGNQLVENDP